MAQLRRRSLLGAFGAAALRPARAASAKASLTLVLDWLWNSNHAAIFAAGHFGHFKQAGLEVQIVAPSDADLPPRLLAAGHADLAIGYGSQINLLTDKGLAVTRIATLIASPLNSVAAVGPGIRQLADLRGKSVGFNIAGVEEAMLDAMLRHAGVDPGSVNRVKLTYDLVSALLTRRLDAAIGAYRNVEVLALRAAGASPVVFLPEEHGVPAYDELIVLARHDALGDRRLGAFVGALQAATETVLKTPDQAWRAFIAAQPELDTPVGAQSWAATLPLLARDPAALDGARYLAFQDFLVRSGVVSTRQKLQAFAAALG